MITLEELRYRMGWSFDKKLDHTLGVIDQFYNHTQGKVYIAFSGGKDSLVVLDIVRRLFDSSATAVFCNTGNEYPAIVKFVRSFSGITVVRPDETVKEVIAQYGFPLISKLQARFIREARHTRNDIVRAKRLSGNEYSKLFPQSISKKWRFLVNAPFEISEKCCNQLKKSLYRILSEKLI